jgi:hypothetical protein
MSSERSNHGEYEKFGSSPYSPWFGLGGQIFIGLQEEVLAPLRASQRRPLQLSAFQPVVEGGRICEQRHARLFRSAIALATVAFLTGGHEIFSHRPAAARLRQDVVERQVECRAALPAVLAAIVIARKDAMAIDHAVPSCADIDIMGQTNDRRYFEGKPRSADELPSIDLQNLGHASPDERQSLRRSYETKRLVRCVE